MAVFPQCCVQCHEDAVTQLCPVAAAAAAAAAGVRLAALGRQSSAPLQGRGVARSGVPSVANVSVLPASDRPIMRPTTAVSTTESRGLDVFATL